MGLSMGAGMGTGVGVGGVTGPCSDVALHPIYGSLTRRKLK
jgi:hypothetical protein